GVERVMLRALGVVGTDDQGVPLVNTLVDRLRISGHLALGASYALGHTMVRHGLNVQEAAERLAFGPEIDKLVDQPASEDLSAARKALVTPTADAIARIDHARHEREALKGRHPLPSDGLPLKYVIVATGNIFDDAVQAKAAAHSGADIVAVIRA